MPVLKNPKRERFAQEVASGKGSSEAYRLAGFKANPKATSVNASRLLGQASVQARVSELLEGREKIHAQATAKAVEKVSLTKEWVLARLIENAERALQAKQQTDNEGNPVGEFKYEGSVANRALELLGKELGMFIDRKETGKPGDFSRLSDADLLQEISQELAELGLVFHEGQTEH